MDKTRLAVIGCGGIADRHLNGYRMLHENGYDCFSVEAVCDVSPEAALDYASNFSDQPDEMPRFYDSVESLIRFEDLDAVDICVPHGYHHTCAIKCIESGLDVMVEKPLGTTVKASRQIIGSAMKEGRILSTAENIRRTPGARAVRWAFNETDLIGAPRMFFAQSAHWHDPKDDNDRSWRTDKNLSGGGLLMDGGVHMMDVVRYVFGEVDRVYAEVRQTDDRKGSDSEDTWVAVINFKNGVIGTWSWTVAAPCADFLDMRFYGSDGVVCYNGDDSYPVSFKDVFHPFMIKERGYVETLGGDRYTMPELCDMYFDALTDAERARLFPFGIEDGYALEIHDFIESVRYRRAPEVDGLAGLQSKAICIALYESGYSGEVVKIADVIDGKVDNYQRSINTFWGL